MTSHLEKPICVAVEGSPFQPQLTLLRVGFTWIGFTAAFPTKYFSVGATFEKNPFLIAVGTVCNSNVGIESGTFG
jgi:hypothetical protein